MTSSVTNLILPRYRYTAGVELAIKILITLPKCDAFHRRKLFNIEYILGVDGFLLFSEEIFYQI